MEDKILNTYEELLKMSEKNKTIDEKLNEILSYVRDIYKYQDKN
jgi:hypothetical protein